jgi:hypothetical protein
MKLWNAFTSKADNLADKTHLCLLKMLCYLVEKTIYLSKPNPHKLVITKYSMPTTAL